MGIRWREVGCPVMNDPPCPLAAHVQLPVTWLVHHAGIAVKPGHRQSPMSVKKTPFLKTCCEGIPKIEDAVDGRNPKQPPGISKAL